MRPDQMCCRTLEWVDFDRYGKRLPLPKLRGYLLAGRLTKVEKLSNAAPMAAHPQDVMCDATGFNAARAVPAHQALAGQGRETSVALRAAQELLPLL